MSLFFFTTNGATTLALECRERSLRPWSGWFTPLTESAYDRVYPPCLFFPTPLQRQIPHQPGKKTTNLLLTYMQSQTAVVHSLYEDK
jgi:hypothetical protein